MRSIVVLSALVALSNGQGYNYNAPSGGGGGGGGSIGFQSGSFGGGIQSSGFGSSSFSSGQSSIGSGLGSSIGSGLGLGAAIGAGSQSGYASGGSSGYKTNQQMFSANSVGYSNQAPIVHKHVYVHVAPEDPEERIVKAPQALPPPTKHYKIIFVKTPSSPAYVSPVIPAQPQNEEKTLVYVLVKKPDEQPDVVIPTVTPTQPSKPEVYFIKYKTQKQAVAGGVSSGVAAAGIASGASGIGLSSGVGVSSGGSSVGVSGNGIESTGAGAVSVADFARGGQPAPKYGPPGYQS